MLNLERTKLNKGAQELAKLQGRKPINFKIEVAGHECSVSVNDIVGNWLTINVTGKTATADIVKSHLISEIPQGLSLLDVVTTTLNKQHEFDKELPFLVFKDHPVKLCDPLQTKNGNYVISLPVWSDGLVSKVLKSIGFKSNLSAFNNELAISDETYSYKKLMTALKPIIKDGNRYKNEALVAQELIHSITTTITTKPLHVGNIAKEVSDALIALSPTKLPKRKPGRPRKVAVIEENQLVLF